MQYKRFFKIIANVLISLVFTFFSTSLAIANSDVENKATGLNKSSYDDNETEKQFAKHLYNITNSIENKDLPNYAKDVSVTFLNKEIENWLNQYGNSKIQLGTHKIGNADVLLPLIDKKNKILFTQFGGRFTKDKTTGNLGLGYRQYSDNNWMWGFNTFYDYEFKGRNSRIGFGSELWFDYLKFSGNSYFRLTDWHNSRLDKMKDYQERPANGFDINVDSYLPQYPQIGLYAKYEKYFGENVYLGSGNVSIDDLKKDPSRATFGLSYTPVPLITIKAETSRGDFNESKLSLEYYYRFGLSLSEQLDPENVKTMRKLAGNRYDFVDRNYDIVMDYRKQNLFIISLPPDLTTNKNEIDISITSNKSKDEIKNVTWSAPELISDGGSIERYPQDPTTIKLKFPSSMTDRFKKYQISAIATDNQNNKSNLATMWVTASSASFNLEWSNSTDLTKANNSDTNEITGTFKDASGNPIVGAEVKITLDDGVSLKDPSKPLITDEDGKVVFEISSSKVGIMKVRGTIIESGDTAETAETTANFYTVGFLTLTVKVN